MFMLIKINILRNFMDFLTHQDRFKILHCTRQIHFFKLSKSGYIHLILNFCVFHIVKGLFKIRLKIVLYSLTI